MRMPIRYTSSHPQTTHSCFSNVTVPLFFFHPNFVIRFVLSPVRPGPICVFVCVFFFAGCAFHSFQRHFHRLAGQQSHLQFIHIPQVNIEMEGFVSFARSLRVLLLFVLSTAMLASAAAISENRSGRIEIRQSAGTLLNQVQACTQYSRVANLSVIGANSTYRAAFLESSPDGTLGNAALLNKAILDNVNLALDPALNQACGNSTAIAITEAANNFTKNVVAQFTFVGNPSAIIVGPIIAVVSGLALLVFGLFTAV